MPSTFVRIVPPGSSHERWTLDWPARWRIRSGRTSSTTAAAAAGSLRSASRTRAPEAARHDTPPWGRTTPWISTAGLLRVQEVHEVPAHEAAGARDQQPHR